jgi:hemoglobin
MCRSPAPSGEDRALQPTPITGNAGCACSTAAAAMSVGDVVHWKEASVDLDFPPVPYPSRRVFSVAGEPMLRALVRRHHERLGDSRIGRLFPQDPGGFAAAVEKAADFIVEASGGPARYTPVNGSTCMRTRHFPFTIDESAREIWLAQLLLAFDDVGFPNALRLEVWNWLEAMSIRMINRRTMRAQPRRHPLAEAPVTLSDFMVTSRLPAVCPR